MSVLGIAGLLGIKASSHKHVQNAIDAVRIHGFPVGVVRCVLRFPVVRQVAYGGAGEIERIIACELAKGDAALWHASKTGSVVVGGVQGVVIRPRGCPLVAMTVGDLPVFGIKSNIHNRSVTGWGQIHFVHDDSPGGLHGER